MLRKMILVIVISLVLLSSMVILNVSFAADTVPPTGSIVINNGDDYTSSMSVILTLTFADTGSGVNAVRYTNNDVWGSEPWENATTSKAWNLSPGYGTKYVSYQIRDNAGLISDTYFDSIVFSVLPVGSILINNGNDSTTSTAVTLTLTFSDPAGSGVKEVRYTNNYVWGSEPWEPPTTSKAWILSSGNGLKYVSYQIRNNVGAISDTYFDSIILDEKVATPTFSPVAGTYSSSQSVALSCSTSGAVIRYTVDGSEPTTLSAGYLSPIPVNSGTVTVKAKAFKSGMSDSDTATATYTIVAPTPTPVPTATPTPVPTATPTQTPISTASPTAGSNNEGTITLASTTIYLSITIVALIVAALVTIIFLKKKK